MRARDYLPIALAALVVAALPSVCFSGTYRYTGDNISIPANVTVVSGDYVEYEGLYTVQNAGNFQYNSGSSGALVAGDKISLYPGFKVYEGATVWGMIDKNFNGISDYVEEQDADGDGYFDALENVMGTSNSQGVEGYEVDGDGDGIFDRVYDVSSGGTPSQYIPGAFMGYKNRLRSFHVAYGTYYSISTSFGDGWLDSFFPSFNEWISFNFSVTYTYFSFDGWRHGVTFTPESANKTYVLQGYFPGVGWLDMSNEINQSTEWTGFSDTLVGSLSQLPPFMRILDLGKANIIPNGTFGDIVSFEGLGEISSGKINLSLPESIGISDGTGIGGWEDIFSTPGLVIDENGDIFGDLIGEIEPWVIDLDGDGIGDFTVDPISKSGKFSVPIFGQTVEIELSADGGGSVSMGSYKIGRLADGSLEVGLPDAFTGGDGQLIFHVKDDLDCDEFDWQSEDVNSDGINEEVAYYVDSGQSSHTAADNAMIPVAESDTSGNSTISKLQSQAEVLISSCNAVQVQYRMPNTSNWKNLGGLHLNQTNECRVVEQELNSELQSVQSLNDVHYRIVRFTADINFPSTNLIDRNTTISYSVNYKPTVNSDPAKNVELSLVLGLSGDANFSSTGNDRLVVKGSGTLNFDIEVGSTGDFEIAAKLAYQDPANQSTPLVESATYCESSEFSVIGLSIKKMKGLYESTSNFSSDFGAYRAGYKSQSDDSGRVYANREPSVGTADANSDGIDDDPQNLSSGLPIYDSGETYVDITVDVGLTFSTPPPSSQVRVVWFFEDPDDPSDSNLNSSAASLIDPNGASGDDNYNKAQDTVSWSSIPNAPFNYQVQSVTDTQTGGYSRKKAYSNVDKNGKSMVRMKLSQAGGDNYKLRVKLQLNEQDSGSEDYSGVFTVWKLVHLEYERYLGPNASSTDDDGPDLSGNLAKLNNSYLSAFVHWDIHKVSGSPSAPPLVDPTTNFRYFGNNRSSAVSAAESYAHGVSGSPGEFSKQGMKGWFYMLSVPYLAKDDWVPSNLNYFINSWAPSEMTFVTDPSSGDLSMKVLLSGHDIMTNAFSQVSPNPVFPVTSQSGLMFVDANTKQGYSFRVDSITPIQNGAEIVAKKSSYTFDEDNKFAAEYLDFNRHGFSINNKYQVYLVARSASGVNGFATRHGSDKKFRGAVVMPKASTSMVTMVHELGHGLGMAHICGNHSSKVSGLPGGERCAMHYGTKWMEILETKNLDQWTGTTLISSAGTKGPPSSDEFCAEHLLEIRKTDLSDDSSAVSRRLNW